jgi:hypothetical protein
MQHSKEDLAEYRLERAKEDIQASKSNLENGYGMFD